MLQARGFEGSAWPRARPGLRRPQATRHAMPAAWCTCCATTKSPAGLWAAPTTHLGQSAKVRVCVAFLQEQLTGGPFRMRDSADGRDASTRPSVPLKLRRTAAGERLARYRSLRAADCREPRCWPFADLRP